MWERFKAVFEAHPWYIAGAVAVVVILIWWYSSSSSSSTQAASGVYAETQDPNVVAANAAQAISQNQTNAAVSMDQTDDAAAIQAATLSGQTQTALATIENSSALSALQSNNASAVTIAGLQATVASQQISAAQEVTDEQTQATTAQTGILASLQAYMAGLSTQLGMQTLADAFTSGASGTATTPLGTFALGSTIPPAATPAATPATTPAANAPVTPVWEFSTYSPTQAFQNPVNAIMVNLGINGSWHGSG